MSDRDRLRDAATGAIVGAGVALLTVVVAITGLSSYERHQARSQSQAYEHHAHDAGIPSAAGEQEACARAGEPSESESEQREKDDLCAQFRSAAAAERMFRLTNANIWLNYFEVGALALSLIFTGWAAVAASQAAVAAARSVALTERDLSERERPRLFIAYQDDDLWDQHDGYHNILPSAWFRLRNVGERAAIVYKAFTSVYVAPREVRPSPESPLGPNPYPSILEDTLAEPGGGEGLLLWATARRKFTDEEMRQIRDGTHFVYVRAVVFYRDHLGDTRIFGFCQVFSGALRRRIGGEEDGFTFLEYTYERKLGANERQ